MDQNEKRKQDKRRRLEKERLLKECGATFVKMSVLFENTQNQMAECLKLSRSQLCHIEKGRHFPSMPTFARLLKLCHHIDQRNGNFNMMNACVSFILKTIEIGPDDEVPHLSFLMDLGDLKKLKPVARAKRRSRPLFNVNG